LGLWLQIFHSGSIVSRPVGRQEHHGRRAWQRRAAHLMTAKKQRGESMPVLVGFLLLPTFIRIRKLVYGMALPTWGSLGFLSVPIPSSPITCVLC
jgi:hypothetical protein